jgi:hypothetical protein
MEKVIRNGKVAVIISPNYGGGWYTWNYEKNINMVFDPILVEMVERKALFKPESNDYYNVIELIKDYVVSKDYVDSDFGIEDLAVVWVDKNRKFIIQEYDGWESLLFEDEVNWIYP